MGKMTDVIDITVPKENEMPKSENNAVQIFESAEFGKIRTVEIDGEVWFYGNDVARVLGYKDPSKSIRQHVDQEDRKTLDFASFGRIVPELWERQYDLSNKVVINESGVYSLIFRSALPIAKKFKRYVTNEILPSVRKHGAYMTDEVIKQSLLEPDFIIKLATQLKTEREEKNKLLIENNEYKAVNAALVQEIYTWEDRKILNFLVARYAGVVYHKDHANAWKVFYSNMFHKYGVNINSRETRAEKKLPTKLDYLTPEEITNGIKLMISMCEYDNVRIGDIIEQHWAGYEAYVEEEKAEREKYEDEVLRVAEETQRAYNMFYGNND